MSDLPEPCELCAPFDGRWKETPDGLRRCSCARGRALATPPRVGVPVVPPAAATAAALAMADIPFFPAEDAARTMIADELRSMCRSQEDLLWLVRRMIRLYRKWPGSREMRMVYCSKHVPLDGFLVTGESEVYPDGIPSENPSPDPLQLPPGATRALPPGHEVSASPSAEIAVRQLAQAKDIRHAGRTFDAPSVPLARPAKAITQADVDREVARLREAKAAPGEIHV